MDNHEPKCWRLHKSSSLWWSLKSRQTKTQDKKRKLLWNGNYTNSNIELLHSAFNTKYSESRYRLMSSSCYQMWNHYTNVKNLTKHMQWLDTDISCKTPTVRFTYTIVEKRQITALVFEKEIGIKCGAINTKNLDLTDERLKTLYRSLYLYIIPDWTFSIQSPALRLFFRWKMKTCLLKK